MTLSGWFRDYVYIPLGGNRKGKKRQVINIAIVWALTGFWHGASWTFLLWGVYFGVILIIEKLTNLPEKLPGFLRHVYSVFLVMIGWMIFAVEDIKELGRYASQVFGFGADGLLGGEFTYQLRNYLTILVVGIVLSTPVSKKVKKMAEKSETAGTVIYALGTVVGIILVAVCIAMLVADSYNPFLYFRF